MYKKILILAGGGGHTGFGHSLAQNLFGKVSMTFLVPRGDLISKKRLDQFGKVEYLIKPREPRTPHNEFIPRLMWSFLVSSKHISRQNDIIISTGSNFCIAPSFYSWLKRKPIINIEGAIRLTKPSRTAKILQPLSVFTALQWPEQKAFLDGIVVGPLIPKPEIKSHNGGYLLVSGGSFGHKLLFDTVNRSNLEKIILQTGEIPIIKYKKTHPNWKIMNYSMNFQELLAGAEVVITHLGSTVLEALVYKKPVVIVPNPEWTRNAGVEDAILLAEKVNGITLLDVTIENLIEAIEEAKKRKVPYLPDGSKKLAKIILEIQNDKAKNYII